ncbi:MAG: hypothetical protein WCP71_05200 [Actinomycetes bacterium]
MPRRVRVLLRGHDSLFNILLANNLAGLGFELPQVRGEAQKFEMDRHVDAPDVAIIDIDHNGSAYSFDLAYSLRLKFPNMGLVFLTSHFDQRMAGINHEEAPRDSSLVIKSEIRDLAQLRSILIEAAHNRVRRGDEFHFSTVQLNNRSHLTNNQVELLRDISMGFSNIQMSKARGVTVNAIENAISRLAKKLQVTQSEGTNQRVSLAALYHRQLRGVQPIDKVGASIA